MANNNNNNDEALLALFTPDARARAVEELLAAGTPAAAASAEPGEPGEPVREAGALPLQGIAEIRFEVSFSRRGGEYMQVLTRIGRIDGMVFVTYLKMADDTVLVDESEPGGGALLQVRLRAHGGGAEPDDSDVPMVTSPPYCLLCGYYDRSVKCAKNKKRSASLVDGVLVYEGTPYLVGPETTFAGLNKP